MKTIHLVFNAHLDPVWLWPWTAGMDEALATFRSACDRLDAHPDLFFSFGEAAIYRQIERIDPALFARVKKHVASGQWEIIGGWWVQPDCNLPSGFALDRQIELGAEFFRSRFDQFPSAGFNPDSFGHCASLPGILQAHGQDQYVFMRPQPWEKPLPNRLFRWRGYQGDPPVTAFRIAEAYLSWNRRLDFSDHVRKSTTDLPEASEHTLCFMGMGDHGGGVTEWLIDWCRKHKNVVPGWELQFSTISRFFKAIAPIIPSLPIVTGELQMHAVGCYSVHRPIKTGIRRTEHLLRQAELSLPSPAHPDHQRLTIAWENACFHAFHDTLGGTCLPSAYLPVMDQLGQSAAVADDVLQLALRQRISSLPDDALQQIILFNASDLPFDGYVSPELFPGHPPYPPAWRLLNPDGTELPCQPIATEGLFRFDWQILRPLFKVALKPLELRSIRLAWDRAPEPVTALVQASPSSLSNTAGARLELSTKKLQSSSALSIGLPHLELIADNSDTWSHGIDRFGSTVVAEAQWEPPVVLDNGPLLASLAQDGRLNQSTLHAEWRVLADEPFIELRLHIDWNEHHKVLKLSFDLPQKASRRIDGIPGSQLERELDGKEQPLRDWTRLTLKNGQVLSVVCPDVFACDADQNRVRFTLLRSCLMAHHEPFDANQPANFRKVYCDRGPHDFRFRFATTSHLTLADLEKQAMMFHRPPILASLTRGMPAAGM